MEYETLKVEQDREVMTVTFNRPDKLNAFNLTLVQELVLSDAKTMKHNMKGRLVAMKMI